MGWIKRMFDIKEEQLRIERESKILLHRIAFELKEIKSFLELNRVIIKNKRQ